LARTSYRPTPGIPEVLFFRRRERVDGQSYALSSNQPLISARGKPRVRIVGTGHCRSATLTPQPAANRPCCRLTARLILAFLALAQSSRRRGAISWQMGQGCPVIGAGAGVPYLPGRPSTRDTGRRTRRSNHVRPVRRGTPERTTQD
jgi:hypothetical protein